MNSQGPLLILVFSPRKKISEIPIRTIQQEMICIFKNRGVPDWIKVDNGRPFGDPQLEIIPILSLWLIGLNVKVIWNRPATPQDNAKVERSQGVMGKWTEYAKCKDNFELQIRLWKEADFHNYHFPIRRENNKTRIELFPTLAHTGKYWNPKNFKLERVLNFLAKGNWERKVNRWGQISIYGKRFSVGTQLKYQKVSIKLDPKTNQWMVFNPIGQLIKKHPSPFTEKSIWNLDLS